MVTTRRKAANKTALKPLQLDDWLEQIDNLPEDEFIRQFQETALKGDYVKVKCLTPFLPDAYYEDGCRRARAVLDAGHQDIFVLLTRDPAFHANDPERANKNKVVGSFLLFLALVPLAVYGILKREVPFV